MAKTDKTQITEVAEEGKHKLLIIIVKRGFAEEVVEKSRMQGATGATILHGRGSAGVGEMFMGMSITPEKEIVLIVIKSELADAAMRAVSETLGITSAAGGVCFCLPVDRMTHKMLESVSAAKVEAPTPAAK